MQDLEVLWASGITPQLVAELPALSKLRALNLYQVGRTDLSPVGQLRHVQHLLIGWANYLQDLSWLAQLPRLQTLVIDDAKRLDLETLPNLPRLQALQLGGGIWKILKVVSLAPLSRLPSLEYLSLSSLAVLDGAMPPLSDLQALRHFQGPNIFELKESARMAAKRPDLDSPLLRPIYLEPSADSQGNPIFACLICGGPKLMPTMRRAKLLCPRCDAPRIRQHVANWEAARASFARGAP